ncbi:MAG TPA: hypothetical protein VHM00_04560 [Caldimonas sp.]|jgi:hypothetical protein|nr:hypothetical protein [Caldimonas sp.]HEX2540337.1 hypothetical protein [Caldimonas sp.]
MATPIIVSIPHQLARWDRDRLTFAVAAMGQAIPGVTDVLDAHRQGLYCRGR